jgi:Rieske Fe-S protein
LEILFLPESTSQGKRTFLKVAALWLFGLVALVCAWGMARFAFFSSGKTKVREFSADMPNKLAPQIPTHLPEAEAWLIKNLDDSLVALDDRCTHLGCRHKWNQERKLFECPCHGSEFDSEGKVVRGPAMRSLPRLAVILEGDKFRLTDKPQGSS